LITVVRHAQAWQGIRNTSLQTSLLDVRETLPRRMMAFHGALGRNLYGDPPYPHQPHSTNDSDLGPI